MQAAFVLAFALTGLGCQNKSNELSDGPPVFSAAEPSAPNPDSGAVGTTVPNPYPRYTTPSSYSGYYRRNVNDDVSDVYPTHWDAVRSTLCSFVIGRDPEVTTTAEIEASVYGDYPGE
jgi:hypothetical protein